VKLISILLCEEILILQLNEKKGKLPKMSGVYFRRVIPTAIVEELRLLGKIRRESEGKAATIEVNDDTPTNEPILNSVLTELSNIGGPVNLVGYLKSVSDKKSTAKYWLGLVWNDLEQKGIIQEEKGKHFFTNNEIKENLFSAVKNLASSGVEPNAHMKSLIGFFRHNLRWLLKGVKYDKEHIKGFTSDLIIQKVFARYVFGAALAKSTKKIVGAGVAAGAQVQGASARAVSGISAAGSDFLKVRGIGTKEKKSWAGLHSDRQLKKKSVRRAGIGPSLSDVGKKKDKD